MQWLIINLLNLARIEADAIDFKREDYKVYDLCKAAKKTLEANFQKKNLSLKSLAQRMLLFLWTGTGR